ncbi:monovalent cation/H(+) antiporter subunit G [Sphingomonas sp. C3-2]|uniref:monovalent cation/H(+) antiporter subunit G n=1 Tax=Sphingomonas sp. C3-2 TaxID=3062169 RepID=UPI00294B71DE|nr:monovalent cation/H(+) antiporter subunit G [Sphingomonas sp. C3-2]WOK35293.1 monovalent cation/H(+) antiporter subunit G [Sphingomonas sp. C3-2]
MTELLGAAMICVGLVFLTLAALGVVRLPDAFQRMHASTKAGTLGAALIVLGAVLLSRDLGLSTAAITILFLLMTLPVAAQLLGRAAYISGADLKLTRPDPLEGVVERQDAPLEERAGPPDRREA